MSDIGIIAAVLVVYSLLSQRLGRLLVSGPMFFVVAGILLGPDVTGVIDLELTSETGLLIASVEAGSPAEVGGLMLGDIIVALDGHAVADLDELLALLSGDRVGKEVPVQIIRGGQLLEVNLTIGERV